MRRAAAVISLVAFLLAMAGAAGAQETRPRRAIEPPEQADPVELDGALVEVPVVVADRSGRYVASLTKHDFELYEDGAPQDLAEKPESRYRALLQAEEAVREGLWSSGVWRRLRLQNGQLQEIRRP